MRVRNGYINKFIFLFNYQVSKPMNWGGCDFVTLFDHVTWETVINASEI